MKQAQGWTFTSLMVALALASVLLLLSVKTVVFSLSATRQTVQLAQLQQSAQLLLNLLQHELRNGNFMAGAQSLQQMNPPLSVDNDCQSSADAGSFPVLNQPFQLLRTGTVGAADAPDCLANALRDTDYLQIKRLAGEPTAKAAIRQNRVYLSHSGKGASFVTVDSTELLADATYWPYLHQIFYISRQHQQGRQIPVLMRKRLVRQQNGLLVMDTDSVLDGVEAMVFEIGLDSNQDGVTDEFSTQAIDNIWNGGPISSNVVQIRFHLLLRSVEPDPAYTNTQQYQLGPRRFDAPGDHFRRLQLSSSVTFIN